MPEYINETTKAYFAGLFDGDGCVTISPKAKLVKEGKIVRRYLNLSVQIGNNCEKPLRLAKQIWGGCLCFRKNQHNIDWDISAAKAEKFLRDIRDFTMIKKNHIDIALDFRKTLQLGRKRSEDQDELQRKLRKELSNLRLVFSNPRELVPISNAC